MELNKFSALVSESMQKWIFFCLISLSYLSVTDSKIKNLFLPDVSTITLLIIFPPLSAFLLRSSPEALMTTIRLLPKIT